MGGRERERECERNEEGGRTAWVFDLGGQVEVVGRVEAVLFAEEFEDFGVEVGTGA